jgi:hypothetical protein
MWARCGVARPVCGRDLMEGAHEWSTTLMLVMTETGKETNPTGHAVNCS